MRIFLYTLMALIYLVTLTPGKIQAKEAQISKSTINKNFYYPNLDKLKNRPGLTFIKFPAYQQTTDYTCGPATLLTIANHFYPKKYPLTNDQEMQIAKEAGTRDLNQEFPGTRPDEMLKWLKGNGFEATLTYEEKGDGTALSKLKEHIESGTPVIVEWSDWGGHWVIAIGYDTRDTDDQMDDVIIFADPYDHHDDNADGYSFFNAVRFYWMWYDALYFGKLTWRTMIVAKPLN